MTQVRRRKVFYLPGFDPFPPRRYRELYRREGTRQAQIAGYDLNLSRAEAQGPTVWTVETRTGEVDTHTTMEILLWADIVRTQMDGSVFRTYGLLVRTVWTYLSTGALWRMSRLRRGPVLAALYPVVALLIQAAILVALAFGVGWLVGVVLPDQGLVWPLQWALGLALIVRGLALMKRLDPYLYTHYLMHDYAFACANRGGLSPVMDQRLTQFRDRIAEALRQDYDEVLIVGHSSGAHLSVTVLARLLRDGGGVPEGGPTLSLLTLGHAAPMIAVLPNAGWLRDDLADMAAQDSIPWVDVTAPGDGCCFALCDPAAVIGRGGQWPLVLSAAFSKALAPARWRRLRRRYFRLHFQYLCAFDDPSRFDYFATTAGPLTLWDRFGDRSPSPGRITRSILPPHQP